MKILVVISSNDAETVWNAFRFGSTALGYENEVTIFLMGKGVEAVNCSTEEYDIVEQIGIFEEYGGSLIGCGVCFKSRSDEKPDLAELSGCEVGSMQQFYGLAVSSDKILTF